MRPKCVAPRTRGGDDNQVAGAIGGSASLLRGAAHTGMRGCHKAHSLCKANNTRTSSSSDSACCLTSVIVSCVTRQ